MLDLIGFRKHIWVRNVAVINVQSTLVFICPYFQTSDKQQRKICEQLGIKNGFVTRCDSYVRWILRSNCTKVHIQAIYLWIALAEIKFDVQKFQEILQLIEAKVANIGACQNRFSRFSN